MGANRRPVKFPAKSRVPLRLATGIAVAGLAWQASPKLLSADSSLSSSGEKIKSTFDGVVRSSRAIYTVRSPPLSRSLCVFFSRFDLLLFRSLLLLLITSILYGLCLRIQASIGSSCQRCGLISILFVLVARLQLLNESFGMRLIKNRLERKW